jgi:hypothetical protein
MLPFQVNVAKCLLTALWVAHVICCGGNGTQAPADGAVGDGSISTDGHTPVDGKPPSDGEQTLPTDGATVQSYIASNVGERVPFDRGEADVVVGGENLPIWVFNTEDGSITAYDKRDTAAADRDIIRKAGPEGNDTGIAFASQILSGGEPVGVFNMNRLEVPEGAQLVGVGGPALILMSRTDIVIDGKVIVRADYLGTRYPGPGGAPGGLAAGVAGSGPGAGQPATVCSDQDTGGGGGGSFGGKGGRGGQARDELAGGAGPTYGNPSLEPLVGGSGGGSGADCRGADRIGYGGNGGGAVQLSAGERIRVGVTGLVDASGGGGQGGTERFASAGGGGGGSGGAILLEAPTVELAGVVGANGGAGGQGGVNAGGGTDGAPGKATTPGVSGPPTENGHGGGGAGSGADGQAEAAPDGTEGGGGGGGGGGRIRINTASGDGTFTGVVPSMDSGLTTVGRLQTAGS